MENVVKMPMPTELTQVPRRHRRAEQNEPDELLSFRTGISISRNARRKAVDLMIRAGHCNFSQLVQDLISDEHARKCIVQQPSKTLL